MSDDVVVPGHPHPSFPSERPPQLFCRGVVGIMLRVSVRTLRTAGGWGGLFRDGAGLAPGFTQPQPSSSPVPSLSV